MKRFKNWLLNSSVDPNKWSLTVKSSLLVIIPFVLAVSNGVFNLGLEQVQLVEAASDLATLVGTLLTAFALARKIYFTFKK